jgi:hypothetical protein
MGPGGKIILKPGDTFANSGAKLSAIYQTQEGAPVVTAEIFVPYDVLGIAAWPESGDLGLSIAWTHRHDAGRITRLFWSDNGHPWSTRWFGVARRDPAAPLPCMIRIL